MEKTVKLIDIANRIDSKLDNGEAKDILKVIGEYSKALDLLDDYDHKTVKKIKGNKDDKKVIDNNTLTTLTLFIAESNLKEKDIIIDLIKKPFEYSIVSYLPFGMIYIRRNIIV